MQLLGPERFSIQVSFLITRRRRVWRHVRGSFATLYTHHYGRRYHPLTLLPHALTTLYRPYHSPLSVTSLQTTMSDNNPHLLTLSLLALTTSYRLLMRV